MLQNAYFLARINADTAENERNFAEILPKIGKYTTVLVVLLGHALVVGDGEVDAVARLAPEVPRPRSRFSGGDACESTPNPIIRKCG